MPSSAMAGRADDMLDDDAAFDDAAFAAGGFRPCRGKALSR
jgi:hypothetical protein